MSTLLLLTNSHESSVEVLPALALLPHNVKILPPDPAVLVDAPSAHAVIIDRRQDLAHVRSLTRMHRSTGADSPLVLAVTEGALAVVPADWGMDDFILTTAAPTSDEHT